MNGEEPEQKDNPLTQLKFDVITKAVEALVHVASDKGIHISIIIEPAVQRKRED